MPAPTNISRATALDVGTLPASVAQVVDFAGTTYTVWYKYTAVSGDNMIGWWAFGDLTVYIPTMTLYDELTLVISGNTNRPMQFAVSEGRTYYMAIAPNSGNPTPANLTLSVIRHTDVTAPVGSIAINDDTPGFPLAILSATADNTPLSFLQGIVAGEGGDVLDNGTVLLQDVSVAGRFYIYTADYTALGPFDSGIGNVDYVAAAPDQSGFYICASGVPTQVRFVSPTGTIGATTWGNLGSNVGGIALSPDQTILYYVASTTIRRWNLTTNLAMSDLVSVGAVMLTDILCLSDGTVIVSVPAGDTVRRYSAAGALLNTYTGLDAIRSTPTKDRLAYGLTDASVWLWEHDYNGSGAQQFLEIRVSDGVILTTRRGAAYEVGKYTEAATATPVRFGNSQSCPFWIVREATAPPEPPSPYLGVATELPIRWVRRSPVLS